MAATQVTEVTGARLRAYIVSVLVAGAALSAWAWLRVPPLAALAFATATVIAELLPARMRRDVMTSLSNVVVLTGLLYAGPALGIASAAGLLVVGRWRFDDRRVERTLFNFGQIATSAASAGFAFTLLGGVVGRPELVRNWLALLVAGIVYTIVNLTLVAFAIRLSSGEPVRSMLRSVGSSSLRVEVLHAGLSILAAALMVGYGPAALVFLVIPMLVARHGLLGFQEEEQAYDRLVGSLMKAIELKDGYTRGHGDRVGQLCVEVAKELGYEYRELRPVRFAAVLHDVGKLSVPTAVLNKPGGLTDEEFEVIRGHPGSGSELLSGIEFLGPAIDGIRFHHERVDGRGYPFGVGGDDLPMVAKIVTACDAFDAMTSTRSYRYAMDVEEALKELRRCAGTQFDAGVVDVLERVVVRLEWEPVIDPVGDAVEEHPCAPHLHEHIIELEEQHQHASVSLGMPGAVG